MTTTIVDFRNAVADLSVTGVVTALRALPDQINTVLLPLSYPRLPEADEGPLVTDGEGGWPTITVERVFVIVPIAQGTEQLDDEATITLADNINAAFRGVTIGQIGKSKIRWSLRMRQQAIGNMEYWCIVARVTGYG